MELMKCRKSDFHRDLHLFQSPFRTRPLLGQRSSTALLLRRCRRFTLATMSEAMKQRFGLIKRPWGVYYLKNKTTGAQTSLKTRDEDEAQRLLQAHNDTESQPHFNLALARVYMKGADPKLGSRTWQEVMEHILEKKTDETHRRWEVAIKDKNFDCIPNLRVAETLPEHFNQALADAKS